MSNAVAGPPRSTFTLRFREESTHRALRLTAELLGVSMNELAEEAIAHELARLGADLEDRLRRTADLLRNLRITDLESDVTAFARAEVEHPDPLRSRRAPTEDPLGVGTTLARAAL